MKKLFAALSLMLYTTYILAQGFGITIPAPSTTDVCYAVKVAPDGDCTTYSYPCAIVYATGTDQGKSYYCNTDTRNWTLLPYSGATIPAQYFNKTIENPTSSENVTVSWIENAITLKESDCVLVDGDGTASVTVAIYSGTDRTVDGTAHDTVVCDSNTQGDADSTFANSAVSAGRWLWIKTTASTGSPTQLHFNLRYTEP